MATAGGFLSEDQFLCCICLDVFSDPVTIACGHSFCKSCLSKHWEGHEQCRCPLCNEKFNKGLKLHVNTALRDIVGDFKKHQETDKCSLCIQPGQVACDYCPRNKMKASKTCLVCLTSFCHMHLEPHQRVPALKRHKLTCPVHNLEDKICKEHNTIFELFCRSDQTRICAQCTAHEAHDTVPLEEEYVDKKAWMRKTKVHNKPEKKNKNVKLNGKNTKQSKAQANSTMSKQSKAQANSTMSNQMSQPVLVCNCSNCRGGNPFIQQQLVFAAGELDLAILTIKKIGWAVGVIIDPNRRTMYPPNACRIYRLGPQNRKALQNFPILKLKPKPIKVLVDDASGLVSFLDGCLIQSFPGINFNNSLSLFFIPFPPEKDDCAQWLLETVTKKLLEGNLSVFIGVFIFIVLLMTVTL